MPIVYSRRIHNQNYLPLTNVTKIMRRVLPPNAKISDESKETIQEYVSQFIKFITSEANGHTHSQLRKTIGADDLIVAMEKLGFAYYVGPLSLYLKRLRQNESQYTLFVHGNDSTMQATQPDQSQELVSQIVPNDLENYVFPPSMDASELGTFAVEQMFPEGGFYSHQQQLPPPLLLPPYYHANDVSFSSLNMLQGNIVHNWTSTTPSNVQYDNIQDPNISSASPHFGYFNDPKSGGCEEDS
ncbi:hypothetical protein Leryth_005718 [Lithospermum erythrorhizon]|uniref:DNA-binding transcription factor n=1 Tax=Lithospermum erythrorhizon TaxID=34254 RepID=A0AAV3QRT0_LITER|nr:hypothetical protein Leryth_005718 [Lithospermum erythrorhizon]